MDCDIKKKVAVFTVLSLVLTLFASLAGQNDFFEIIFFLLTGLGSVLFMVIACYFYAKGKEINPKWSLAGLIHVFGLILLTLLPFGGKALQGIRFYQ